MYGNSPLYQRHFRSRRRYVIWLMGFTFRIWSCAMNCHRASSTCPCSKTKTFSEQVDHLYDKVGHFLDQSPTVYKVVIFASHLFRSAMIASLMAASPFTVPVTCVIAFSGSLVYRAAVERFCCFRFALPSCVGATSIWIAKSSVIHSFAGITLRSIACQLPLPIYITWAVIMSHRDVEKRVIRSH